MAAKATPKVVEVILPTAVAKKNSVKYETDVKGAAITNLYLNLDGCRILGNPSAVKVTIEAHNDSA